ncbi:MAG: diaminopimelate epimerase [Gemmatimonadaceae bacterium]|nr:diaminopimelate epimerase [Gemmatimonadaceae bacterium]
MIAAGAPFWKMSGSGNDFVFFDARNGLDLTAWPPERIQAICAAHTGVGADGIVLLTTDASLPLRIIYFNRDGSRGELCGNASLCTVRLAAELGIPFDGGELRFGTDSGTVTGRLRPDDGRPEIDLGSISGVDLTSPAITRHPEEAQLGFASVGVPHLVVVVPDAETAELPVRGPELRYHLSLTAGANVNFVSRRPEGWRIRTWERGVEAETLACGTGCCASAALLAAWGLAPGEGTILQVESGRTVRVRLRSTPDGIAPSLSGEGRVVYTGQLAEL